MADNSGKNATTKSPAVKPPVAIGLRAAVGHAGMGLNHSHPEELAGAHLDVVLAQEVSVPLSAMRNSERQPGPCRGPPAPSDASAPTA